MKIEHFYQFLAIVEAGSISKASQNLFVSQQHLSRIVTALENDLQCQLLIRTSTGVSLTALGKTFVQYAKKILDDYREMQSFFYYETLPEVLYDKNISGSCTIAVPYFFSLYLTDFIQEVHSTYPNIELDCLESPTTFQKDDKSNILYLILTDETYPDNLAYTKHFIGNTLTSVCVNRSSILAQKKSITTEDFALQTSTIFPASAQFNHLCGCKKTLFTSSNIYQHLDSVKKNNSVCIVPSYIGGKISEIYPDIILIPLEQKIITPMYLYYKLPLTEVEKTILRFWVQYLQKIAPEESMLDAGLLPGFE